MDGSTGGRRAAGGPADALAGLIMAAGQLAPGAAWRPGHQAMPPMLAPGPGLEAVAARDAELGGRPLGQVWLVSFRTQGAAATAARRLAAELEALAGTSSTWRADVGEASTAARVELAASSTGPRPLLALVFQRRRHLGDLWVRDHAGVSGARLLDYARRLDARLLAGG